jgi:Ner family transcriptional regulator
MVKAAIHVRGETLQGLAKKNGYSRHYLANTLIRPLLEGERIIGRFLGLRPEQIWPDRYDPDGTPNHRKWRRLQRIRAKQQVKPPRRAP